MCCLLIGFSLRVQHDMCRFSSVWTLPLSIVCSQCIREKLILTLCIVTWKWRAEVNDRRQCVIALSSLKWKKNQLKVCVEVYCSLEHDKWIVDDDNYNSWFCIDLVLFSFFFFIFLLLPDNIVSPLHGSGASRCGRQRSKSMRLMMRFILFRVLQLFADTRATAVPTFCGVAFLFLMRWRHFVFIAFSLRFVFYFDGLSDWLFVWFL